MRRGKARSGAAESGFAESLTHEKAPAPASLATPLDAVGALLALQEVPDADGGRARALAQGSTLLDVLDEIRHGLLMGTLPRQRLQGLVALVGVRRESAADPKIKALLDEIELRARVELAKLGLPA